MYVTLHIKRDRSDVDDRKLRLGFVLLWNDGPAAWGSCKQTYFACSTIELEYIAGYLASHEITWLYNLLAILGAPQIAPTASHNDNQFAIKLVKNLVYHKRTKHIGLSQVPHPLEMQATRPHGNYTCLHRRPAR